MANLVNLKTYLWALGTIQPASAQEAHQFIKLMTNVTSDVYSESDLVDAIERALSLAYIENVSKKNALYILTAKGGEFLGKKLRLLRDKNRLFLLKSIRDATFSPKDSPEQDVVGVSPTKVFRSSLKVAPWPENSLSPGPLPQNQRVFWPRVSEQLQIGSISGESSPSIRLNFYSKNKLSDLDGNTTAIDSLSESIGISPRLLSSFIKAPSNHYRTFTLQKKSSTGTRVINSPRAFIKTVQYWLNDYFLFRLKLHDCCFSFRQKVSIKDNAKVHLNSNYILCLDIESFFDNITKQDVLSCLVNNKIELNLASVIAGITTLDNSLPQGAPTSPIISNAYLYDFDQSMLEICTKRNMTYSRYADDLTFGSNDYSSLKDLIPKVSEVLHSYKLTLNKKKTRIISSNNSQVITGVSINNGKLRPNRKLRKEIRVAFYQAKINRNTNALPQLYGYINYLKSFEDGDTVHNLELYQSTINELKFIKINQVDDVYSKPSV
ncbi:retron St85 family RNA-directed DNA polymerase [Vibrio splendidus]|uniref:retron St85 family RNA-directed DNA polymerase n=1 Tax=Vibrio splendidus TaxID=29497 RepID=UPI003D1102D8